MRQHHKDYSLLVCIICVFFFCVLGLVTFARNSGSSARFVYSSQSASTHTSLLNDDGTAKQLVVPSGLAHIINQVVFHSSSLEDTVKDPFFTFYTVDKEDAVLYLSNLLYSVGGAANLFYAIDNRTVYTPPPNLLPELQDQSCVGSCYAHAAAYTLTAARKMLSARMVDGVDQVPPSVLINIQENMAPSRAFIQYYYKRIFKSILGSSPLTQGGHPVAALLAVKKLGCPLESQYSYPSDYYRGFKKTTRNGLSYYTCKAPHVSDATLADVFQKYAVAPPGGVVALSKIYGYDTFQPKILYHNEDGMLDAIACSFSIENACKYAYSSAFDETSWKPMSYGFVTRLRQALSDGLGVAIGIPVFDEWSMSGYSYKLPFPVNPNTAQVTGYHAMAGVNFTLTSDECTEFSNLNVYWDGSQMADAGCVTLRNSWGEHAGDLCIVYTKPVYLN